MSFAGEVSDLIKNSVIQPESEGMKKLSLILGRYYFDKNPFIGKLADINVWNRFD